MLLNLFNKNKRIELFNHSVILTDSNLNITKVQNVSDKTLKDIQGNFINIVAKGFKRKLQNEIDSLNPRRISMTMDVHLETTTDGIQPFKLIITQQEEGYQITAIQMWEVFKLKEETETLYQWALLDPLTQLLNRRGCWIMTENMIHRATREGRAIGIVVFDMDRLKEINTEYGHEGGDRAIKEIANIIRSSTRKTDVIARLGGDEFAIIFDLDQKKDFTVEDMAERILRKTRKSSIINSTVSVGAHLIKAGTVKQISDSEDMQEQWEEHMKIADEYSMQAKQLGKDQAVSDST